MWWSMWWDAPNNRWDFTWGSQKIVIGKNSMICCHRKIRGTIEDFSDVRGESTA